MTGIRMVIMAVCFMGVNIVLNTMNYSFSTWQYWFIIAAMVGVSVASFWEGIGNV